MVNSLAIQRKKHSDMGYIKGYIIIICDYCGRKIYNKKTITKNGCIWCDAGYHRSKNNV